jgi:hypothetical protein
VRVNVCSCVIVDGRGGKSHTCDKETRPSVRVRAVSPYCAHVLCSESQNDIAIE